MIRLLTNFNPDYRAKGIIGGTFDQQLNFINFLENEPEILVFGLAALENPNQKEKIITEETEKNYFGISFQDRKCIVDTLKTQNNLADFISSLNEPISQIEKVIKEKKIEAILINGFSAFLFCFWKAAQKQDVPVIYINVGWPKAEIKTHREFFAGSENLNLFLEAQKDLALNCAKMIFLNEFTKNLYEKDFLAQKSENSVIIPAPISPEYINAAPKNKKTSPKIKIGLVGRWDEEKNHKAFLEVAKYAHSKNLPFEFLSVTNLPKNFDRLGIKDDYANHIQVIAPMQSCKLKFFYQEIDALACPSIFESFGKIIIESLLCGTPALISKNVGAKEIYDEFGLVHWISDFNNPLEVIEKLENMAKEIVPENLIQTLKNRYDSEKIFLDYLEIIKKIKK